MIVNAFLLLPFYINLIICINICYIPQPLINFKVHIKYIIKTIYIYNKIFVFVYLLQQQ